MKQIIPVKGMGCAKCKARVENALNVIAGVNEAIVDYDPAETSLEKMREEVEKAGYQLMVEEAK